MASLLYRLGRFSARRHWFVIVSWFALIAIAFVAFSLFKGPVTSAITIPGTPTSKVTDELSAKFPSASGGTGTIVFDTKDGSAFTATQRSRIEALLKKMGTYKGVKSTTSPFAAQSMLTDRRQEVAAGQSKLTTAQHQLAAAQSKLDAAKAQAQATGHLAAVEAQLAAEQAKIDTATTALKAQNTKLELSAKLLDLAKNARFVSTNGSAGLASIAFDKATNEVPEALKNRVVAAAEHAKISGVSVYVSNEISQGVPSPVGPAEIAGLIVAGIVLLVMLGTIIGAGLPMLAAIGGLGFSLLAATAFSGLVQFNSSSTVLGIMLGLAVGIDYSLFILNRHRRQLRQGMGLQDSIGLANGTSGNAVVFAGITVFLALLALNLTGVPFLGLMGTIGAAAVAVAILVAITFTPALMSIVGMRILRKTERAAIGPTTSVRVPNNPMATWRAIVTLVAGIALLGVIALPALQMRLGLPDGSSEATTSTAYKAFKVTAEKFGAGQNGAVLVVANLPKKATGDSLLQRQVMISQKIGAQKNISAVVPGGVSTDGTVITFKVIPTGGPSSVSTENLVTDLRAIPAISTSGGKIALGVAGNTSAQIDVAQKLSDVLPLYLLVVVGLSFLILIIVFRSILVPLTAAAGFLLSLLAAFGGLTAVFQWGWLGAIFGVHDPGPIVAFVPIIEVGVVFGLAMDYQLFLVSGMRESQAHGTPAKLAVQRGLHAGRPVVTAAAIIMISVFAGFIFSDSATIRPIGFGLAFGVLIDAFVVRMLLIPAAMHLLGKSAWWFPKWLDRIVPNVDVEGANLDRGISSLDGNVVSDRETPVHVMIHPDHRTRTD